MGSCVGVHAAIVALGAAAAGAATMRLSVADAVASAASVRDR
jgi:hypothetical protein